MKEMQIMDRLTKWFGEGENRVAGLADDLEAKYTPEEIIDLLLAALAPYEDTGLEAEEIREAYSKGWHSVLDIIAYAEQAGDVLVETPLLQEYINLGTLDHLRELIQAEQDGRLVVLPPPAKYGEPKPECFYNDCAGIWCLGYSHNGDDEPTERCKQCWYCRDYVDDSEEAKAALEARTEDKG